MVRNIRKPRSVVGNKGKFGRLLPVHFGLLCPGETVKSHKVNLDIRSLPIQYAQAGATYDVWSYIVPIRLLDTGFVDFLMGDSTTYNGQYGVDDHRFPGSRFVTYGMSAYEMIVKDYFRTDEDPAYTYDMAEDLAALSIVDMTGEMRGSESVDDADITIDVSGGTLSLKELEDKKAQRRYEMRVEALDGRYLSYLKMNGVNANEQLTDMAEFIGHGRKYIEPRKTVDQSTGFTVQNYALNYDFKLRKPRFVSEHSLLVTVCSVRPKVHIDTHASYLHLMTEAEKWPHKGQLLEHIDIDLGSQDGAGFIGSHSTISDVLFHGDMQVNGNMGSNTVRVFDPSTIEEAKFPTAQWDTFVADRAPLGGDADFTIEGICSQTIATPLRQRKVA